VWLDEGGVNRTYDRGSGRRSTELPGRTAVANNINHQSHPAIGVLGTLDFSSFSAVTYHYLSDPMGSIKSFVIRSQSRPVLWTVQVGSVILEMLSAPLAPPGGSSADHEPYPGAGRSCCRSL